MLTVDYTGGVTVGRNGLWQPVPPTPAAKSGMHLALIAEWRGFADAGKMERRHRSPVRTGRHIMVTIFAAEESSRRHEEIAVMSPLGEKRLCSAFRQSIQTAGLTRPPSVT